MASSAGRGFDAANQCPVNCFGNPTFPYHLQPFATVPTSADGPLGNATFCYQPRRLNGFGDTNIYQQPGASAMTPRYQVFPSCQPFTSCPTAQHSRPVPGSRP
jgi:hypothetical protein